MECLGTRLAGQASGSSTNRSRAYHFPFGAGSLTRTDHVNLFTSAQLTIVLLSAILLLARTTFAVMSQSHVAASGSSSSNFQLIFNNALKAYEKRTKQDLLVHPLASQLQACESPGDILAILQQQIQGLDQSRSRDERWTKWLDPTVNVVFALSATLGSGVGLVCSMTCAYLKPVFSYIFCRYFHQRA